MPDIPVINAKGYDPGDAHRVRIRIVAQCLRVEGGAHEFASRRHSTIEHQSCTMKSAGLLKLFVTLETLCVSREGLG